MNRPIMGDTWNNFNVPKKDLSFVRQVFYRIIVRSTTYSTQINKERTDRNPLLDSNYHLYDGFIYQSTSVYKVDS